jgi:hypothetical protein
LAQSSAFNITLTFPPGHKLDPSPVKKGKPSADSIGMVVTGMTLPLKTGGVLATLYGTYEGDGGYTGLVAVISMDGGYHWSWLSTVASHLTSPGHSRPECALPSESSTVYLKNGSLFTVFRSGGGGKPLCSCLSHDDAKSWTVPVVMAGVVGVEPKLRVLKSGHLALSTGRPGIYLYTSPDPPGQWQRFNIAQAHNKLVKEHELRFAGDVPGGGINGTTSYTGMAVASDTDAGGASDAVFVSYDRLGNGWGTVSKGQASAVFVMKLSIEAAAARLKTDEAVVTARSPAVHPAAAAAITGTGGRHVVAAGGSSRFGVKVGWSDPPVAIAPIVNSWHDTAQGTAGNLRHDSIYPPSEFDIVDALNERRRELRSPFAWMFSETNLVYDWPNSTRKTIVGPALLPPNTSETCPETCRGLTTMADGTIALSHDATTAGRMNMSVFTSVDGGGQWHGAGVLYRGPSAYSTLTPLGGNVLGVLYERGPPRGDNEPPETGPYENITFAAVPLKTDDSQLSTQHQQRRTHTHDTATSATAPLVCAKQPRPFVAVAWNPTCECTGNVTSDKLPCNACYTSRTLANYACRTYPNIVPLALLQGNLGKSSSCGPPNYKVACSDLDFGTYSNISVACAIDQTDPVCSSAKAVDLTRGVGTSAQPFGEKFIILNWVQPGQPIMEHPADALKLTSGSCPSTGSDNNKTLPPVFSGVWWTHGIEAIADQAELFFPAYKRAGGELNELVADWEAAMFGPQSCPLPDNSTAAGLAVVVACVNCVRDKWRAIEADPRFPLVLTELQALGFQMNGTLADTMIRYQCVASPDVALRPGGLADCSKLDGLGKEQHNMNAWHALIEQRQTDAWVRAIQLAARKSFAEVRLSLYDHFRWDPKFCAVPDVNSARMTCAAGKGEADSLVSAPVYYDVSAITLCLFCHRHALRLTHALLYAGMAYV